MMDKLRNNPRLIFMLLFTGFILLIASSVLKSSNNNQEAGFSMTDGKKDKEITLKVPGANIENISVVASPDFEFVYSIEGGVLIIKPLSLLVNDRSYTISAEYSDPVSGQVLANNTIFLYEETDRVSELLGSLTIAGEGFDLLPKGRHSFVAFVTLPGLEEEKILKDAGDILKTYGLDPKTVDLSVEYSRSAKEDGVSDPFSPVIYN